VTIPANGSVTFEPGGYHIMLTGLAAPLKDGQKFDLNLGFLNGGVVKATATVKAS
jgi:copper(I)-binding protein